MRSMFSRKFVLLARGLLLRSEQQGAESRVNHYTPGGTLV
jgi:hypothetical protein